MELELDLKSVRNFAKKFRGTPKLSKQFQAPSATRPSLPQRRGANLHQGRLRGDRRRDPPRPLPLANLLLLDLVKDDMGIDKRLCIVGSVTANTNTSPSGAPRRTSAWLASPPASTVIATAVR